MPVQFTEDFIISLNNISKLFLCGTDIKVINWNIFTKHIVLQPDLEATQSIILESTVLHHLSVKYPLRKSYCKLFLKTLISEIERQGIEVSGQVYTAYCNILQENCEEKYNHRHFQLPDRSFITLKESSNFISEGTTGLYTWQGAVALAEWCVNNTELLCGSHLLELGSGAGLTGIIISSVCAPASYCFSDCHPGVLQLLEHNIKLNEAAESKSSPISPFNKNRYIRTTPVEVLQIDWEKINDLHIEPHPDIVLAADVVYDNSLFSPLISTLKHFLISANTKAVLACTERNPETLSQFLTLLESSGFTAVEESQVKPCVFTFSLDTPIRIFTVHNG